MIYNPHVWVILKIIDKDTPPLYKILCGWNGAYDEPWRMNSGVKEYHIIKGHAVFIGHSGSTYECLLSSEGLNPHTESIYQRMTNVLVNGPHIVSIELISFSDFQKEFVF